MKNNKTSVSLSNGGKALIPKSGEINSTKTVQGLPLSAQSDIGFCNSDSGSIKVGLQVWFDLVLKGQTLICSIEYFWNNKEKLFYERNLII